MQQTVQTESSRAVRRADVYSGAITVACLLLFSLLVLSAAVSLRWRPVHDSPLMLYAALLFDHFGRVPYRDLFDMNMPGTYAINILLIRVLGTSDLAFRVGDLVYLTALLVLTWCWMLTFGKRVATASVSLVGLVYLSSGPEMSFQREFLALLPVAAGLFLTNSSFRLPVWIRGMLLGVSLGLSATIKPQFALALLIVLPYFVVEARADRSRSVPPVRDVVVWPFLGAAIPVIVASVILWQLGALADFVDGTVHYWPLYGSLTGNHQIIPSVDRPAYLATGILRTFVRQLPLLLVATMGVLLLWHKKAASRRQVRLLIGLTVFFGIYPAMSGQFWDYHELPFRYFLALLASLCLMRGDASLSQVRRVVPPLIAMIVALLVSAPLLSTLPQSLRQAASSPRQERVDAIANYLKQNLRPGDSVQPLDWTGGAVNALYITQAPLATRFMYDFHFYHHDSSPYIQQLRAEFITSLTRSSPRYIVEILPPAKPIVSGIDTSQEFPALRNLIERDYSVAARGESWIIYEHK